MLPPHMPWCAQAPEPVIDPDVGELLQTQFTAWGRLLTCPLLPRHEAACKKVEDLPFFDLAAVRQVNIA